MYEIRTVRNVLRFKSKKAEDVLNKMQHLVPGDWQFYKDGELVTLEDIEKDVYGVDNSIKYPDIEDLGFSIFK